MTTPTTAVLERRLLKWWQLATPIDRMQGRIWYTAARREVRLLAQRYGYPHTLIAAVAAVLSPSITWKQNLLAVDALLAGRQCRTYHKHCAAALGVLHGTHTLTGDKRIAFAAALAGDDNATVIDRWMLRAVGLPATVSGTNHSRYHKVATAVTNAANQLGVRPAHLQAAVWLAIRAVTPRKRRVAA